MDGSYFLYSPSTDWAFGGPIIERERIALNPKFVNWQAIAVGAMVPMQLPLEAVGPTALVAAMRVYVVSKFGVKVGEEL